MDEQNNKPKDDVPPRTSLSEQEIKKYAFVSQRALENDHIGYCYRDEPENNIDSGWRFLFGDEDEEYLDNPENVKSVYPDEMLSINSQLEIVLGAPINSEFEWDEENMMYLEM